MGHLALKEWWRKISDTDIIEKTRDYGALKYFCRSNLEELHLEEHVNDRSKVWWIFQGSNLKSRPLGHTLPNALDTSKKAELNNIFINFISERKKYLYCTKCFSFTNSWLYLWHLNVTLQRFINHNFLSQQFLVNIVVMCVSIYKQKNFIFIVNFEVRV